MGHTSANFALVRNLHWSKQLLTMRDKCAEIAEAAALIILGVVLSLPSVSLCAV